ncbi:MAG: hypothetical protein GX386_04175 [Clostridiaceae bacterium]|jgi:hypothetical protein|nr:hypothetical protein [Clostridiaceae bacterium]
MAQHRIKANKYFLNFYAGLITGVLLGSALAITLVSYKIDIFYEKIAALENTIIEKNAKLENLEKSINSNKFVLKDIEIILLYEDNEIDHLETIHIEKTVKEKYSILLGTEVKSIDPDIITLVVDKRILKMNGKEIQLHVNKLKLTEVLKLWIEADVFF